MFSAGARLTESRRGRTRLHTLDAVYIAALCGTALLLRLGSLSPTSLYRDDTWQALATQVNDPIEIARAGVTAPGYAFMLRGWSAIAGDSALALQLPAVLACILLPAATYLLVSQWTWSRAEALVAATILVTGESVVLASVRVKPYLLEAVICLCLIAICVRLCSDVTSSRRWLHFCAAAAAALVFSSAQASVLAGAAVAALVAARRAGRLPLAAAWLLPPGLAACGWYLFVIRPNLTEELHDFWNGNYAPISGGLTSLRTSLTLGRNFFDNASPETFSTHVGLLLALVAGAGIVALAKKRRWELLCVLVLPVFIAVALATLEIAPFGTGRTDVYLLPGVAITAAHSISLLPDRFASRTTTVAPIVCLLAVACAAPAIRGRYPFENLRDAVETAQAARGSSVRIVVFPEFGPAWALYGPDAVTIDRDRRSMNAFTVGSPADVLILPSFQVASSGQRNTQLRADAAIAVADFVDEPDVVEVWVVRSDLFVVDDLPEVYAALQSAGFDVADGGFEGQHGIAQRWLR